MSYFKKTNIFKQIFFSRGTVVVLFFLLLFMGFALYSVIGKSINAANERKMAEAQMVDLDKKQAELSAKIDILKTPEGQADALKEQYPVVSPGEHVVVINDDTTVDPVPPEQPAPEQQRGFWDYLKNLFK